MVLFMTLLVCVGIILGLAIIATAIGGVTFLLLFGDLLAFIFIVTLIVTIIKKIRKKK